MNLLFTSIIFFLLSTTTFVGADRVRLREITSLTLKRGEYTTGRRSSPVPQLECVGGTAYGKYSPKVVQCYNRGWDGQDVQWKCEADMSSQFQFGKIEVNCEGYEYPNDPFILAGSCGLRYELDYSATGAKRQTFGGDIYRTSGRSLLKFENIVYILFILFVVYLLYLMFWPGAGAAGQRGMGGAGGGGGGNYPPNDGPPPPGPGWNPPPSYDDTCGGSGHNRGSGSGGGGPGFFSGLGLGALGGYLWNRGSGYGGYGDGYRYRRPWGSSYYNDYGGYDSGYYGGGGGGYDGSGPSTSSDTHTSSGYGGTTRR